MGGTWTRALESSAAERGAARSAAWIPLARSLPTPAIPAQTAPRDRSVPAPASGHLNPTPGGRADATPRQPRETGGWEKGGGPGAQWGAKD